MASRATTLRFAAAIALVATVGLTASSLACDSQAKSATATACAAQKRVCPVTANCCAAKPAVTAAQVKQANALAPLATAAPAAPAAPFASLPNFAKPAPVVAGLMAFLDPETGLLTGPIGDLQVPDDLNRAFAAPVELTPVTLPNGSVMIDLQGTLQDYYILNIDPFGNRSVQCVPNVLQAKTPPSLPAAPAAKTKTLVVSPIAER